MPLAFDAAQLPKAYDLRQARIELDRLAAAWTPPEDSSLPDPTQTQALLTAIFGNSPYLSQLVVNEAAHFSAVLADGPDSVFNKLLNDLAGLGRAETDESSLMRGLRQAKRRAHLTIAVADIIKAWPLEQVTSALSDFADVAVQSVVSYLLRAAHVTEELDLPHPDEPTKGSGLVVLGLGKLGARELNYSSDIDLIVLFDLDIVRYRGKRTARECFVKLARNLVRLLSDSTQDGYVLRVDLRLRPDPASTPLALSTVAADRDLAMALHRVDLALDRMDVLDGGEIQMLAPDEGLEIGEERIARRQVAGDGAPLDHRRALPILAHALVIGLRRHGRQSERGGGRIGTQTQIHPQDVAVLG
jgi:glutamine synthetase adenylyltransferase